MRIISIQASCQRVREAKTIMLFRTMPKIFFVASTIALVVAVSLPAPLSAQAHERGTFVLKISGILAVKGQIKIAMFNTPETWLGDHPAYHATVDVDSLAVTWKISDIPYGDYGIAVFHDENKNGKIDKNFLGIPQEPYGFSNNMRIALGPPSWDKSKFVVKGALTELSIEVK
jgi:uncharacterized protein (DUF2141 family)